MLKKAKKSQNIYLDYAASTPMDPGVFKAMRPYLEKECGNPSSVHNYGRIALAALDNARKQTADLLNCSPDEIVFTSGATEANNLAVYGLLTGNRTGNESAEIITTAIEHQSILETCRNAKKYGALTKILPVNNEGLVDPQKIVESINKNTKLVTIMYANNEIGVIEPIGEIGRVIANANKKRAIDNLPPVIFHTDAAQAPAWLDCDVKKLNIDLLTISGHKMYGPKGVGALYVKNGTPLYEILNGGKQEYGLRAGTQNVAGIVGMGEACTMAAKRRIHLSDKAETYKKRLYSELKKIKGAYINGPVSKNSMPNILNFGIKDILGEELAFLFDRQGIAVSTGSACSAGINDASHVLIALGHNEKKAREGLRASWGGNTVKHDLSVFAENLNKFVNILRSAR